MVYKQVRINITKKQLDQALNGKSIRLLPSQIGSGSHHLSLHPANVKLIEKAALKGKGCNLSLSEGELMSTAEDLNGEGIFGDIWSGLKSGYNWVKKNIIDSDIYQKAVKPIVKGLVDQGAAAASAYAPSLAPVINTAKNAIGNETGAFGAKMIGNTKKSGCSKAARMQKLKAKGLYLS